MQKTTIKIKGTHCTACKVLIEDVFSGIPGIHSCDVNYQTGETIIEHDEDLNFENLDKEIRSLGDFQITI